MRKSELTYCEFTMGSAEGKRHCVQLIKFIEWVH